MRDEGRCKGAFGRNDVELAEDIRREQLDPSQYAMNVRRLSTDIRQARGRTRTPITPRVGLSITQFFHALLTAGCVLIFSSDTAKPDAGDLSVGVDCVSG